MKNQKVYLTLFVSILLFSQSLFAQDLKMQNDRSLEPENRTETKTNVTIQSNNEFPKLVEKRTSSNQKSVSQEVPSNPKAISGAPISTTPIVKKEVNSNDAITPNKVLNSLEGSNVTIEKRDVNSKGTSNAVTPVVIKSDVANSISKQEVNASGNTPVQVQKKATSAVVDSKVTPMTTNTSAVNDTEVSIQGNGTTPFYNDASFLAKLKSSDVELYKKYLQERQVIVSVLNRVQANTFKNAAEQAKYTQLLNQYKQKYNF